MSTGRSMISSSDGSKSEYSERGDSRHTWSRQAWSRHSETTHHSGGRHTAYGTEASHDGTLRSIAESGHPATDRFGQPLVLIDPKAERRLRIKIDLLVLPTVAVLYFFCAIDKANIAYARIAGLEGDLRLRGYDYNTVLSVFYVPYILLAVPSTLLCKWMGPGWYLPLLAVGCGVASLGTAFVTTLPQLCGLRFLLGAFEAGVLPGTAYYLSRWYRRAELAPPLAVCAAAVASLAAAFGGPLASGILDHLRHFGGLTSWRTVFALEGTLTMGLGIVAFFTIADRPATAFVCLRRDDRDLAIARVKSERVAATSVLDGVTPAKLGRGLLFAAPPPFLGAALISLLGGVALQGLLFLTPVVAHALYPARSAAEQQLYAAAPPYLVGGVAAVVLGVLSARVDRRLAFVTLGGALPATAGYAMLLASADPRVRYAGTFLVACAVFPLVPLTTAHVSANVVSDTARSVAIGMNLMFWHIGGLISTWSFVPADAPNYRIGSEVSLAASALILFIGIPTMLWMDRDNKKRDNRSIEEQLSGLDQKGMQDLDWKHPAFRWHL